jgi:hypothetical protein
MMHRVEKFFSTDFRKLSTKSFLVVDNVVRIGDNLTMMRSISGRERPYRER